MPFDSENLLRKYVVDFMVNSVGYPSGWIAVEQSLSSMPHLFGKLVPNRRFDLVCFFKDSNLSHSLYPLIVVECKLGKLKPKDLLQLLGYNIHVEAPFVCLTNGENFLLGTKGKSGYRFVKDIRLFTDLLSNIKDKYCVKDY